MQRKCTKIPNKRIIVIDGKPYVIVGDSENYKVTLFGKEVPKIKRIDIFAKQVKKGYIKVIQ